MSPPPAKKIKSNGSADPRFHFKPEEQWARNITQQPLMGSKTIVLEPLTEIYYTTTIFDLPDDGIFLPGNKTRFYVEAVFNKRNVPVLPTEAAQVIVETNWFEKIIDSIDVFNKEGQNLRNLDVEPSGVTPYVNTLLYTYMNPALKKFICQEPAHPGNAVSTTRAGWDFEGEDWKKYSEAIFTGGSFKFSFIPLVFPFFQQGSFTLDKLNPPRAVNLTSVKRIAINWKNYKNNIFFKKEGNTANYSVQIKKIRLAVELGVENYNKEVIPKNLPLEYRGSTRKAQNFDLVNQQQLVGKFDTKIKMPSSLLFFMLPKDVVLGSGKFQDNKDQAGFLKNFIDNISIYFNEGCIFQLKQALRDNLPLNNARDLETHYAYPICNIPVDQDKMTLDNLINDGTLSAFPHIYIRLSPGYNQRLIPDTAHKNLIQYEEPGDLKFDIRFKERNTLDLQKTSLLVYALYDDVHATFDPKTNRYVSLYNLHNL
jgi:hypothetical protein